MLLILIKSVLMIMFMTALMQLFKLLVCLDKNNYWFIQRNYFIVFILVSLFMVLSNLPFIIILEIGILLFLSYMDCNSGQVYAAFVILFVVIAITGSLYYNFYCFSSNLLVGIFFYSLYFIKVYAKADGELMFGIVQLFAALGEKVFVCAVIYFLLVEIFIGIVSSLKMIIKRANLFETKIPAIPYMTIVLLLGIISGFWEDILRGGFL